MSTHIFSSKSALSISALVVAVLNAQGDVPFSFSSDFSTLAPSSSLFGAAQLDSGILKLTEPINTSFGVYSISMPADRTFQTLHAGWKSLIGGGAGGGADGYSFNVATDLPTPPAYGNPGEEGAGSGLSVTVDTFDNGGGEVGLEIKWKGAQVAFQAVPKDDDGSGNFLRKDQFVDASVDVSPNGVVIFSYDGNVLSAALPSFIAVSTRTPLCLAPARAEPTTGTGLTI
jgi:hypothetical protein